MLNLSAIILAAGEGKRMNSKKSKLLHEVCFKPLIHWVYDAVNKAGATQKVLVVGHRAQQVMDYMGEDKTYALQKEQLGTGHAVMQAMPNMPTQGCIVILAGDAPLVTAQTIKAAAEFHNENKLAVTVITAELFDPTGYGRVIRNSDGSLLKIVEQKDATEAEKSVKEINSGLYCFDAALLHNALGKLTNNNAQGEYYLTDTIEILLKDGYTAGAFKLTDSTEIMGINNRVQLAEVNAIMQKRILEKQMLAGVTIIDPTSTIIGDDVIIGSDTVIYPGCIIKGKTTIGEDGIIGPNTSITDSIVAEGCEIINSVVLKSQIGSDTHIGPFAYIRPNCNIGSHVKVGDFVEVKNSNISEGTKISHLTYIGDSDVGCNVNFGCGTVTVNYDSKKKHRTTIMDNAFIGCNTNLVAPVTINENAYTAAGSTITKDVPQGSLGIARSRQENILDWVTKRFGGDKK